MKIIFLDIDGVLNNEKHLELVANYRTFDPYSVHALNRALKETGAYIVVSSTWRYMNDVDDFNERFKNAGIIPDRVIGLTPTTTLDEKLASLAGERTRGREISLWLQDHPEITEWIAIDDDTDMDPLPISRVIPTSWSVGMNETHADAIISILGSAQ